MNEKIKNVKNTTSIYRYRINNLIVVFDRMHSKQKYNYNYTYVYHYECINKMFAKVLVNHKKNLTIFVIIFIEIII